MLHTCVGPSGLSGGFGSVGSALCFWTAAERHAAAAAAAATVVVVVRDELISWSFIIIS